MTKLVLFISILLFLTSCSLSNEELKESWWKYGDGYHLSDVLRFNSENLRNDTIYLGDIPKAIIITRKASILGFTGRTIIVKDLESKEIGTYHQK